MSRVVASYKLKYGLAKTLQDDLLTELRDSVFSLNIDEATSKTDLRVLAVLVSHFSLSHGKLMVHHLGSLSLRKVTAESLLQSLTDLFESLDLPWSNVLSIMMDSCAVMRGSKSGLETLIRKRKSPHLIDVDGDACHHAHNASKVFCSAFDGVVERLLTDLHTDFKWSAEHKELLSDICIVLEISSSVPVRYVPHRWLSILDSTQRAIHLLDALTLFYFSFLNNVDKEIYLDIVNDILKSVGEKSRICVQNIQKTLVKKLKTFMSEGRHRKERIIEALFTQRPSTLLTMHLYSAVLPNLKKYVKMFQSKSPMIHHVNLEQQTLLEDFFLLFVKPESIHQAHEKIKKLKGKTSVIDQPSYLKHIDLDDKKNIMPLSQVFVGTETENLMKATVGKSKLVSDDTRKLFLGKTIKAYLLCGKALQSKMPLENKALKICSALDPSRRCLEETGQLLFQMPRFVPNLSKSDDFAKEVRSYNVTQTLHYDGASQPIDKWWADLKERYPLLCQGVFAMLSCFHGPLVESSFSAMSNIMDCHSARLGIDTLSAVQSVRHFLQARDTTAVTYFSKTNPPTDAVDKKLTNSMQEEAYKINKEQFSKSKEFKTLKRTSLGVSEKSTSSVSSQKTLELQEESSVNEVVENNRDSFFGNLSKRLQTDATSSFYDLKCTAQKVSSILEKKYPVTCQTLDAKYYIMDYQSAALFPNDSPHLVPVEITGDGNCLPRCASLFAFQHQRNHVEMRARIVVELVLHEHFYLDDSCLQPQQSQASSMTKSYAMYSDFFTLQELTPGAIKEIFRKEVLAAANSGTEMGMWQVHAVSSILKKPLMSIYPVVDCHGVRKDLHRTVQPRISDPSDQAHLPALMWTRMGSPLPPNVWRPNHFAACLPGSREKYFCDQSPDTKLPSVSSTTCAKKRKSSCPDIKSYFCKKTKTP